MTTDILEKSDRYAYLTRLYRDVEIHSNCRVKRYRCKDVFQVSDQSIFADDGYCVAFDTMKRKQYIPPKGQASDPERSMEESKRRARSACMDIASCNNFDFMMTLTLDGCVINRYDAKEIYKRLRVFLSNKSRLGFKYLLVPEYHSLKDGESMRAIHFHGLCSLGSLTISPALRADSKQRTQSGRPIYNLDSWKFGFSTLVPLDQDSTGQSSEHATAYIAKYITKSDEKIFGKWYLSSRNLQKKPDIDVLDSINVWDFVRENPDADHFPIYRDMTIWHKVYRYEFDTGDNNASD